MHSGVGGRAMSMDGFKFAAQTLQTQGAEVGTCSAPGLLASPFCNRKN